MRDRRTSKHCGEILKQLESAVEGSAGNHVEGDIGITVVAPIAAGAPSDHREDDHPGNGPRGLPLRSDRHKLSPRSVRIRTRHFMTQTARSRRHSAVAVY